MPTLNQRRASLLKSENIAVENTGDVYLLQGIFKHTDPLDWRTVKGLSKYYYGDVAADTLPDGYTAHPISWFYEHNEAVNHIPEISNMGKPTFEELKAMDLPERIEALKAMGYVDGAIYRLESVMRFSIDTKATNFGNIGTVNKCIDGGRNKGWIFWDGKWAEIISTPKAEAPHPKPIPEYVKVVRFKYEAIWYKEKIGQVFKVEKGEDDHYYVTFNETKNFFIIHKSDCIPCDANGNPIGEPQPEAEIIGWELGIDVPEWSQKAGKSTGKRNTGSWNFSDCIIAESILRDMKSAKPTYKRTTAQIIHDLVCGRISEDEAVKLIETKTA